MTEHKSVHHKTEHGKDKDIEWRRLKLISVSFKEASLDTPSFRAHVNHFQTKVELLEDWIEKTVGFAENHYNEAVDDFQRTQITFLSQLLPSPILLSNGFVANQLYTPSLVETFNRDYADFNSSLLKMLSGQDSGYPNAMLDLMIKSIEPYKGKRSAFEYYQNKHDSMLNQQQALNVYSGSVTPESIREDAVELYEVRQSYLDASLELVGAISMLKLGIDRFVMQIMGLAQLKNTFSFQESGKKIDLTPVINEKFLAYSEWVENSTQAARSLQNETEHAKHQVLEFAAHKFAPSRDLNDFNLKAIDPTNLISDVPSSGKHSPEKYGWLYMKTSLSSPQRKIWVRRWCFLKNSVFGFFLLSLSKTYVEETDKFGVFLSNVKYEPDEDRKYCFELKIAGDKEKSGNASKDIKVTLQAENLADLKSWINAFVQAKSYASKLDPNSVEYKMASTRSTPEFFEFASSTTTSMDQALTSFNGETKPLVNILDENFSGSTASLSTEGKLSHFCMAVTPIATKMTSIAILSNFYHRTNRTPNAIIANIWGTTDWSDHAISDEDLRPLTKTSIGTENVVPGKELCANQYPSFYPPEMKIKDIQFKSLFFVIDHKLDKFPDELLLFNFGIFWCPNKNKEFSATCYVTEKHLFCYMNSMGFISLAHFNLKDLVSVEVGRSSNNMIKVYDTEGLQLRMYVYFSDHRMVAEKLQYLLESKTSVRPKTEEEILKKFDQIDQKYQELKVEKEVNAFDTTDASLPHINSLPSGMVSTFWSMSATAAECFARAKELQTASTITYHRTYDISPKTLMHILFGDQSTAFPRSFFLAKKYHPHNYTSEWRGYKTPEGITGLIREIRFGLNLTNSYMVNTSHEEKAEGVETTVKQRIIGMTDGKFYEVDQDPFIVKVVFCNPLRVTTKYIIMQPHSPDSTTHDSSSSALFYVYYKLEFINPKTQKVLKNPSFIERIVMDWALRFTQLEYVYLKKLIRYYMERIGTHGKLVKAVKLCGKIGVLLPQNDPSSTKQSTDHPAVTNEATYGFILVLRVIIKCVIYRIVNLTFLALRTVAGSFFIIGSSIRHINRSLLVLLSLSIILNLLLVGKSTAAYWVVRKAENTYRKLSEHKDGNVMQRAIFIKDLDFLTGELTYEHENLPFNKFKEVTAAEDDYIYRDTRKQVAFRRNELLVELKILQNVEKELVQGKYREFLLSEQTQCDTVKNDMKDVWDNSTELREYCESCHHELERLTSLLL